MTKEEFSKAAEGVRVNIGVYLPKMIDYKNYVQRNVVDIASRKELEDVRDCRLNQSMIQKLSSLAKSRWQEADLESLYCAAMAVATIIKEYDWGTQFLTPVGLYEMAVKIKNA